MITKKAKIVLVSSGQPSLNPRLVKEADALIDAGHDVTVLYCYWNAWGTDLDSRSLPLKKWKAIRIGGDPVDRKNTYNVSRLIHKLALFMAYKVGLKSWLSLAVARGSYFLLKEVRRSSADLYIGHNLGALPAVVAAAKKNNAKAGFDAEDYHRGEAKDDPKLRSYNKAKYLEDRYFPQLQQLTAASPLIASAYQNLYPAIPVEPILNVFPTVHGIDRDINNGVLKLFWFSQTIGPDRGLEVIVKALGTLPKRSFELHLLGDADDHSDLIEDLKREFEDVYLHRPIIPDDIIKFATLFDIGIASENSLPLNHDICLANKIFTYLQAGLAVLASDTTAQKQFMLQHPDIGHHYPQGDHLAVAEILSTWAADRELLRRQGVAALQLARNEMNWEMESKKFLALVDKTLA